MKNNKNKSGRLNQPESNVAKDEKPLRHVKFEINEFNRLVPVVQFAFHDRVPDGYCQIPGTHIHEDIWDQCIGCNVQPVSNAVRVLIRPDVSKQDAQEILRKIIKIIDEDKYDWPQETDNYLDRWRKIVEKNKRRKKHG